MLKSFIKVRQIEVFYALVLALRRLNAEKNEKIKENRMKLKKCWSIEILKCYTPTNQPTDGWIPKPFL